MNSDDLSFLLQPNAEPGVPDGEALPWTTEKAVAEAERRGWGGSKRTFDRLIADCQWMPEPLAMSDLRDELGRPYKRAIVEQWQTRAVQRRHPALLVQVGVPLADGRRILLATDGRGGRRWVPLDSDGLTPMSLKRALGAFARGAGRTIVVWPHGEVAAAMRALALHEGTHELRFGPHEVHLGIFAAMPVLELSTETPAGGGDRCSQVHATLEASDSHLDLLESEAMHIMREVVAQAEKPVMLYSIGKDSAVMLHIARKAFAPGTPPFPLMHVDTRWKFHDMYLLRDEMARQSGMELIVYQNPEGVARDINPITHGSALHTDIMKTEGLKQALDLYKFDAAFGGARRDEEKSRAKERIFSFRNAQHRWDPKHQRPELWNLYNARHHPGESMRVFPLSNWTELDIWLYIYREGIPIVPLYFARERPMLERAGTLIMVDDDRLPVGDSEEILTKRVRFRTLGCYPLSGAVESDATDLPGILLELIRARTSERQGRLIDSDSANSMEKKKVEGYF